MAQQDDYYYEIQLTNKQLVFYFLAGATGLILSFLAGVMVGRGVDNASGPDAQAGAGRPIQEERIVAEEPAKPSPPPPEELTYAQRLESDKADETLEKPAKPDSSKSGQASKTAAGKAAGRGSEKPTAKSPAPAANSPEPAAKSPEPAASAPAAKAGTEKASTRKTAASPSPKTASPPAAKTPGAKPGTFTIQVGAFKDKETADSVVARLKKKGFAAFVIAPEGADGLFNVRVGSFAARTEAERIQAKLREEEKFKPFIVKN